MSLLWCSTRDWVPQGGLLALLLHFCRGPHLSNTVRVPLYAHTLHISLYSLSHVLLPSPSLSSFCLLTYLSFISRLLYARRTTGQLERSGLFVCPCPLIVSCSNSTLLISLS